jgi:hypothetical protein
MDALPEHLVVPAGAYLGMAVFTSRHVNTYIRFSGGVGSILQWVRGRHGGERNGDLEWIWNWKLEWKLEWKTSPFHFSPWMRGCVGACEEAEHMVRNSLLESKVVIFWEEGWDGGCRSFREGGRVASIWSARARYGQNHSW